MVNSRMSAMRLALLALCGNMCGRLCVIKSVIMAINLSIDTELLNEALIISDLPTKKDTVNQALVEFVQRRKQREITQLFGSLPNDIDYDYKQRPK